MRTSLLLLVLLLALHVLAAQGKKRHPAALKIGTRGNPQQQTDAVAKPVPLPACWVETWAKPVAPGSPMHHSGVAYVRRNASDFLNVQFYCNHGTCPGFASGADKMFLVSKRVYQNAEDCPEYLISCDMLRTKAWSKENQKEHFTYMKEGHVCNADTQMQEYSMDNKIKNKQAFNSNGKFVKDAYEICSASKCQVTPAADGKVPALTADVDTPVLPDVYNIWKKTPADKDLYQYGEKGGVYQSMLWWKAQDSDTEGIRYADLVPADLGNIAKNTLWAVRNHGKYLLNLLPPILNGLGNSRFPGALQVDPKYQKWEATVDTLKNKGQVNADNAYSGTSAADFVVAGHDFRKQGELSTPQWLEQIWFHRDKLKID